jgi:hypothetical protein
VCREAVSEGAIDGRGGGHGSLWATGSWREVFEERQGRGNRIVEEKEWCFGPWCFDPWCMGLGSQLVKRWLRSC